MPSEEMPENSFDRREFLTCGLAVAGSALLAASAGGIADVVHAAEPLHQEAPQTAPAQSQRKSVKLTPEDRARMARLYEEIDSRQNEIGMIFRRTLGLTPAHVSGLVTKSTQGERAVITIEIFNDGWTTSAGCYDHTNGVCFSPPC